MLSICDVAVLTCKRKGVMKGKAIEETTCLFLKFPFQYRSRVELRSVCEILAATSESLGEFAHMD